MARFAEGSLPGVFPSSGALGDRDTRNSPRFGGGMGRMASMRRRHGPLVLGRMARQPAGKAIYGRIREFADRFQARDGSLVCRELLGFDISDPEGLRRATESGLFASVCPEARSGRVRDSGRNADDPPQARNKRAKE